MLHFTSILSLFFWAWANIVSETHKWGGRGEEKTKRKKEKEDRGWAWRQLRHDESDQKKENRVWERMMIAWKVRGQGNCDLLEDSDQKKREEPEEKPALQLQKKKKKKMSSFYELWGLISRVINDWNTMFTCCTSASLFFFHFLLPSPFRHTRQTAARGRAVCTRVDTQCDGVCLL